MCWPTRARVVQFRLGEIAGIAAVLAIESGRTLKTLDVRDLQRRLLAAGFALGEPERLRERGLVMALS